MKSNLIYVLTIATSLLYEGTSFAGGMDSGGGQGYVCFDSQAIANQVRMRQGNIENSHLKHITSLETLDLFEAKLMRGISPRRPEVMEIEVGESFEQYLDRIITRIEKHLPHLGKNIREAQKKFSGDQLIWAEIGLMPVFDSKVVASYDTGFCTLTTIAIQFKEESLDFLNIDPRFFWHPKIGQESQAILLLHEYIYLIARDLGKTSSRSTRLAIALLLKDDGKMEVKEVATSLFKLGIISQTEFEDVVERVTPETKWALE